MSATPPIAVAARDVFDAGDLLTLHVALVDLSRAMSRKGALGDDAHGEVMREGYHRRAQQLLRWLNGAQ